MKYIKKPIVIEAFQIDQKHHSEILGACIDELDLPIWFPEWLRDAWLKTKHEKSCLKVKRYDSINSLKGITKPKYQIEINTLEGW